MTSPKTSIAASWPGSDATTRHFLTPSGAPSSAPASAVARAATAGLLAIAAMLFPGTQNALVSAVSSARDVTAHLDADLARLDGRSALVGLTAVLESEVTDAVDSARAATDAAESALAGVPNVLGDDPVAEGKAALALSDAQVAVEAAVAQVRHVREKIGDNPLISDALGSLQNHLDALRLQQPSA